MISPPSIVESVADIPKILVSAVVSIPRNIACAFLFSNIIFWGGFMNYKIDDKSKSIIVNQFITALKNNDVVVNVINNGTASTVWENQHITVHY